MLVPPVREAVLYSSGDLCSCQSGFRLKVILSFVKADQVQ